MINSTFPEQLILADVKPVFKKNVRTDKENYIPVSILSSISKIFERRFYKQLYDYFDLLFTEPMWVSKRFSCCKLFANDIEKYRRSLDQGGVYGTLLTDVSKDFDCLPHELTIAKLYAYGVDMLLLKLINSYLSKRR